MDEIRHSLLLKALNFVVKFSVFRNTPSTMPHGYSLPLTRLPFTSTMVLLPITENGMEAWKINKKNNSLKPKKFLNLFPFHCPLLNLKISLTPLSFTFSVSFRSKLILASMIIIVSLLHLYLQFKNILSPYLGLQFNIQLSKKLTNGWSLNGSHTEKQLCFTILFVFHLQFFILLFEFFILVWIAFWKLVNLDPVLFYLF